MLENSHKSHQTKKTFSNPEGLFFVLTTLKVPHQLLMEHPLNAYFLAVIIGVGISEQFYIELRTVLVTSKVLITKETVDGAHTPELVMQSLQHISIIPLTELHHLTSLMPNGHTTT